MLGFFMVSFSNLERSTLSSWPPKPTYPSPLISKVNSFRKPSPVQPQTRLVSLCFVVSDYFLHVPTVALFKNAYLYFTYALLNYKFPGLEFLTQF